MFPEQAEKELPKFVFAFLLFLQLVQLASIIRAFVDFSLSTATTEGIILAFQILGDVIVIGHYKGNGRYSLKLGKHLVLIPLYMTVLSVLLLILVYGYLLIASS